MLTKEEKLVVLNSMCVLESDADGTTLYYCLVENNQDNVSKLLEIGVPQEEVDEMTSDDGKRIDISQIAFSYGEAEWYQNDEFMGYVP